MSGSVFRRLRAKAREAVLLPYESDSPLGKRVYSLRDTCLTTWLNLGIPPAQAADWASNSVQVLHATYVRCIAGQVPYLLQLIEGPDDLPEAADGPHGHASAPLRSLEHLGPGADRWILLHVCWTASRRSPLSAGPSRTRTVSRPVPTVTPEGARHAR